MKKIIAQFLTVTLLSFTFVGCGGTTETSNSPEQTASEKPASEKSSDSVEKDKVDVTDAKAEISFAWWGGDARHEATQTAVTTYMANNPNVTIKTDYGAWTGWEEKVSTALYANTAADINQANWSWLINYDNNGNTFVDLNEYADYIDLSQFPKEALDTCTVDGKLYGLPIAITGRIFYWNADTFKQAGIEYPKTFKELLEAGEIFKTKLGDDYYPLVLTEYDRMIFMVYYLESKYGKAWIENDELQYGEEEIAEVLQLYKDMEAAHVIPTIQTILGDGAESVDKNPKWMEGKYAGILEWDSSASKFQGALNNPDAFTVGEYFADLGEFKGGFTKVSMCFAVSKSAKDPVACVKFLNYLLNEKDGVELLNSQRGIPCSKAGLEICKNSNLLDGTVAEANQKVVDWCSFKLDEYFEDAGLRAENDGVYYDIQQGVSYGDYTPVEAANILINGVNEVIGK